MFRCVNISFQSFSLPFDFFSHCFLFAFIAPDYIIRLPNPYCKKPCARFVSRKWKHVVYIVSDAFSCFSPAPFKRDAIVDN